MARAKKTTAKPKKAVVAVSLPRTDDATAYLEQARAAIVAQAFGDARRALIAAWNCRRVPAVANLIDVVGEPDELAARIAAVITPRVATTFANAQALYRATDPAMLDPRVSRFAIDELVRLPFTTPSAEPLLHFLIDLVVMHADQRLFDVRGEIDAAIVTRIGRLEVKRNLAKHFSSAVHGIATYDAQQPPAEAALVAEIEKLVEPLRKSTRSVDTLLAEVYANPADDGPRLVLADALQERGDPRGELIALQIERGNNEPSQREQDLLKKYGKAWLGSLAPVLSWGRGYSGTKFRRGFVAVADIIQSVGRKLDPIRTDIAWSTVEELAGSWDHELLMTAPLRALHTIERPFTPAEIAELGKRASLPSVRKIWVHVPRSMDPDALRRAFPNLETLAAHKHSGASDDLDALGKFGIDHVAITNNWFTGDYAAAKRSFNGYVAGLTGKRAPMARLTLEAPREGHVELQRNARGVFERV